MSAVINIATARRSIRWIPVEDRVPDNRRPVLAWGVADLLFGVWERNPMFLGVTRYNPGTDGSRGRFDCERLRVYSTVVSLVTHWAEITGP
mgnify:CR=1 FL=1